MDFIFRAVHGCWSAVALAGVVVLFAVAAAHASVTTKTVEALSTYPDGGQGLEAAITLILDEYEGQSHIAAREILAATASASDEQMVAIGRALAARARVLAQSDLGEFRAVAVAVRQAQNEVLQKVFWSASGGGMSDLAVPAGGGDEGRFDSASPN